jgi:uncharacterized membrane protein YbhN (UPF0104 family)
MKKRNGHPQLPLRRLVFLGLALLGLYVVVPKLGSFASSLQTIRHASAAWLGVALAATIATYVAAAMVYLCLAQKRLRPLPTVIVQFASNVSNKLLPAGIGAIGVNYQYLRRSKHAPSAAAAAVATNNVLGFVGNILLLLLAVAVTSASLHDIRGPHIPAAAYYLALATLLVGGAVWASTRAAKLRVGLLGLLSQIAWYRRRPWRLLAALLAAMLVTACYTLVLYASAHAIGLHTGFSAALIIMSIGVVGATVTPTPGGLGGAEAGLVGAFVLYGVSSADALAAALLYRFFTYWLALVLGAGGFVLAGRRGYL